MKNKVIIALLALAFVLPMTSSAYFTDANIMEELQSQIASLLKQVAELQAKLKSIQGQQGGFCHTFNSDLKIGSSSDEVGSLLTILVKEGIASERGSNFANQYDETMASYVTAFQEKYKNEILTPAGLKYGTGYLGARTRAKLNSLYGCQNSAGAGSSSDNNNSSLGALTVIYPNGGETFTLGSTQVIKWVPVKYSAGAANNPVLSNPIKITLVDESGNQRFIGQADTYASSFSWSIPECTVDNPCSSNFEIAPGNYKIITGGPGVQDISDQYFTIKSKNQTQTQKTILDNRYTIATPSGFTSTKYSSSITSVPTYGFSSNNQNFTVSLHPYTNSTTIVPGKCVVASDGTKRVFCEGLAMTRTFTLPNGLTAYFEAKVDDTSLNCTMLSGCPTVDPLKRYGVTYVFVVPDATNNTLVEFYAGNVAQIPTTSVDGFLGVSATLRDTIIPSLTVVK